MSFETFNRNFYTTKYYLEEEFKRKYQYQMYI